MALVNEKKYGPALAGWLRYSTRSTRSVADRWMLGWPDRVTALIKAGVYRELLTAQVKQEMEVLASADTTQQHLAEHEILAMAEISPYPPVLDPEPSESYP